MEQTPQSEFLNRNAPPTLFSLMVFSGISAGVMNMFLPSLPSMTEYFETDYRLMQLSVALFLALNGVMQIFIGPLSDRFGRRPVMLGGFVIFTLATLGCIFSKDVYTFLVFRGLQVGVVVAMVLTRASIRDMYTQDEAASKIGYVTMGMAVVPMLSPALGGLLDETFGWQATFWVFFLAGLIGLALIWFDYGETNQHKSTSFSEQFRGYPELLTSPRFWGYALTAAFTSGVFFSFLGGAPFLGSVVFELTPSTLGIYIGAPGLGYMAGNFLSARFAMRFGVNPLVLVGSLVCAAGMVTSLSLFLAGLGSAASFFAFMTLVGVGNGMVLPNAVAGSLSVRPQLAGTASGLGGALMIGGGAILSAWTGSLLGPGTGPFPLLYVQCAVSTLAVVMILLVIRRERNLSLKSEQ